MNRRLHMDGGDASHVTTATPRCSVPRGQAATAGAGTGVGPRLDGTRRAATPGGHNRPADGLSAGGSCARGVPHAACWPPNEGHGATTTTATATAGAAVAHSSIATPAQLAAADALLASVLPLAAMSPSEDVTFPTFEATTYVQILLETEKRKTSVFPLPLPSPPPLLSPAAVFHAGLTLMFYTAPWT